MASFVKSVWILHQDTGLCLVHRNFGGIDVMSQINQSLFGGLITAIMHMAKEIAPHGGNSNESPIQKIQMPQLDLHYATIPKVNCAIVCATDRMVTNKEVARVLSQLSSSFQLQMGIHALKLNENPIPQLNNFRAFEKTIDETVNSEGTTGSQQFQYQSKTIEELLELYYQCPKEIRLMLTDSLNSAKNVLAHNEQTSNRSKLFQAIVRGLWVAPVERLETEKTLHYYDKKTWTIKINSIYVNPRNIISIDALNFTILRYLPYVNDVLGIDNFEKYLEEVKPLENFIESINTETIKNDVYICLIINPVNIDNKNFKNYSNLFALLAANNCKNIEVVIKISSALIEEKMSYFDMLFNEILKNKLKVYFHNANYSSVPHLVGKAGVYSFNPEDWKLYKKSYEQKITCLCCSSSTITLDIGNWVNKEGLTNYSDDLCDELSNILRVCAEALLHSNTMMRKSINTNFGTIKEIHQERFPLFFAFSQNYLRLWNYDGIMNKLHLQTEELMEFLQYLNVELLKYTKYEEEIYYACGLPSRFSVAIASAKFSANYSEGFSKPEFLKSFAELQQKVPFETIKFYEMQSNALPGGHLIELHSREGMSCESFRKELTYILNVYRIPIIMYDFRSGGVFNP